MKAFIFVQKKKASQNLVGKAVPVLLEPIVNVRTIYLCRKRNMFKPDILFTGLNEHAAFQDTIIAQVRPNKM